MAGISLDFTKIRLARLDYDTPGIDNFKSHKQEMVEYVQKWALKNQRLKTGTTWTWIYDNSITLGYVSFEMCCIERKDAIRVEPESSLHSPYSSIPAMLMSQLAVHQDYVGSGIGRLMYLWSIDQARILSKKIGCRIIVLHPQDDVKNYIHEKLQFVYLKLKDKRDIMCFDLLADTDYNDTQKLLRSDMKT